MTQGRTAETVTIGTGHPSAGPRRVTALIGRRIRPRRSWRPGLWRRGAVPAFLALVLALLFALHGRIPNRIGNFGSLVETFLPWLGLAVPVLLVLAVMRRSALALVAVVLPAALWCNLFGGLLISKEGTGGDFTVATHNVDADNKDPAGTARQLAEDGPDVVALEELTPKALPVYEKALAGTYHYRAVEGTVGLWSKYPLSGKRPVDTRIGWVRALRAAVDTPHGKVAVYVAHLPSVRVQLHAGFTASQRDVSAVALGRNIEREPLSRVVLLGDLNGTMNDRALNSVTSQMRSTQGAAGDGYGFSWPASFPMARIDQIMVRGVDPRASWTLPRTGSDHLPIEARLQL